MNTTVRKEDRKNPEESANLFSLLFFWWTVPLFRKGAKRDLEMKDLYDPLKFNESERLGDRLEREWKKELMKADEELTLDKHEKKKSTRKPSLMWAIARMFWAQYMLHGILLLIQVSVLKVMQPVFQGFVISYFHPDQKHTTQNQVLLYAGLLVIVTLGIVFITHHSNLRFQQIGMSVRVACCSLLYRKVLRLDLAAANSTATGRVANLMSNDVSRFDMLSIFLHYVWIMPIQIPLLGYVMWQSIGMTTLVGIGAIILQSVTILGSIRRITVRLRSLTAVRTDERVELMNELISGIQVVKMYSWEKPFELLVSKVRALELKFITYMSYVKGIFTSIMVFSERLTLYVTLIAFVLMGNSLTAEVTFVLATLMNILQSSCLYSFPQAIIFASETVVSLNRLTDFLLLDEAKYKETDLPVPTNKFAEIKKMTSTQQIQHGVEIKMSKATGSWVYGQLPPTLCQVSLEVRSRSLCAIVGPVGSGKSSLLHLLLGELPVGAGSLSFFGGRNSQIKISSSDIRVSYASQDPWLFSASVRHNILFGLPYDERRYQEVTRVCALHKDFEELPQGDLSFVGERGSSLSGGQKARVNLARAVYRDADLYLFDDPLSAVDPRVGCHLFEECITGFLKDKTRLLVTHQLQYLREADTIVVLNSGTVERQGTYQDLVKSNSHIFDTEVHEISDRSPHSIENDIEYVESKTVTVDHTQRSKATVAEDVSEETIAAGTMSSEVYSSYFLAGGNLCSLVMIAIALIAGQVAANGTDYWVKYWTSQEILRATLQSKKSTTNNMIFPNNTESNYQEAESFWFNEHGLLRPHQAIYVYTVCIIGCSSLLILRSLMFIRMCMNASHNIHLTMFANLLRAPMRFFNTNPSGRILNRFSKDVGAMDELLPPAMLEMLQIFTVMIGIFAMVVIVNNWMILPTIIMGGACYIVRIYYLKTAQSIKRLEGISKSPVFSQVSSTLDGLTTIRSRGLQAERLLRREFDRHQDLHTGAWYLVVSTANAFGLILDLISCCFITCVCFSFILMDDGHTLGESVGLAISSSLILTGMVQAGIRQSTEVSSQMTSVERILQYTDLPKERSLTSDNPPPSSWPSKGGLIFKDVTMKYAEDKPPVLKTLNVTISPGWKVGIVGRTGAGKSSLISALFRLTGEGLEGEIVLDGIDTASLGLHELRPRISIIPQEPILFSATLRYNLDPFNEYDDPRLWETLKEVELGNAVPSLDFHVAGGGANFSVGQRQLICLTRAILRNNRILVLDEATANVDPKTDALIQKTIRRRFADCTVLTIAHRLNTIMDSDRVMVMSGGRIEEFDHPHLLLKNSEGHFSKMLKQTGNLMSRKLAGIAENAFHPTMIPELEKQSTTDSTADTDTNNQNTHS